MPTIRQKTAMKFANPVSGTPTVAANAWPAAVLAGSRILVHIQVTDNADPDIDVSGVTGGGTYAERGEAQRISGGLPAGTTRVWQAKNVAGGTTVPTVTFTGLAAAGGPYVEVQAYEIAGDDPSANDDENIPPRLFSGAVVGTADATAGPVGPSARDDVLLIAFMGIPNVQAIGITNGSMSQVDQGNSGGSGDSLKVTSLVASKALTSAGQSGQLDFEIPTGQTRQYSGVILAIPGPSGSAAPRHIYDRAAAGTVSAKLQALIDAASADTAKWTPAYITKTLPQGAQIVGPNAPQGVVLIPFDPASGVNAGTNRISINATLVMKSNVRVEVDSGVTLVDNSGSLVGMFTTSTADNWSVTVGDRTRNGGYWLNDVSVDLANAKSRFSHGQDSGEFLIEWCQVISRPGLTTAWFPTHSTVTTGQAITNSPRNFCVRHIKGVGFDVGFGLTQWEAGWNCHIEDLQSDGGTVNRVESSAANAAGMHNFNIIESYGSNGNYVVTLTPHDTDHDHGFISGIRGVSMFGGLFTGIDDNTAGHAGQFTNITVDGGCIVAGTTAQDPADPDSSQDHQSNTAVDVNHTLGTITITNILRATSPAFAAGAPGGTSSALCTVGVAQTQDADTAAQTVSGGASGGGGGTGGAPRSFPLGLPDTTGFVTIDDPGIANASLLTQPWTPTHPGDPANSGLRNGVDYVINAPLLRTRALRLTGGRDRVVPQLLIRSSTRDPEMVRLAGGDVGSLVAGEHWHLDPNGYECDAMKTIAPFSGRDLQVKALIIEKLIGSTDPSPTASGSPPHGGSWIGVHADALQASGGIGNVWLEAFHISTTYQGLQLQQEAKLDTSFTALTGATWARSGSTATITKTAHGLVAGQYVSHTNFSVSSSTDVNGGFKVETATANTYTVTLVGGNVGTGASGTGGTIQRMLFGYTCGSLHLKNGYIEGFANTSGDPSNALGALRIGARTAPVNNSHPNEDETNITDTALPAGTVFEFIETYIKSATGGLAGFAKPDDGASNWATIRGSINTAPTPDQWEWASWPRVTGVLKLGPPATPFVTLVGGIPTAADDPGGGGTAPTPTNSSPPVITPTDPTDVDTLDLTSLGGWSSVDTSTTYTVTYYRRLAGDTGSGSSVHAYPPVSPATALAEDWPLTATSPVGFQYRVGVLPDNGSTVAAAEAFSAWTSPVVDHLAIALTVTIEADQGRAHILVTSSDPDAQSNVSIVRQHPSGKLFTVRGMERAAMTDGIFSGWDYELPIGRDLAYQAIVFADPSTEADRSPIVTVRWDSDRAWIKDPLAPARNMQIETAIDGLDQEDFETPTGVFTIIGRTDPVTRSSTRNASTGDLGLITRTLSETAQLHLLLASGRVLLYQTPVGWDVGSKYLQPLKASAIRMNQLYTDPSKRWTISYAETGSPIGDPGSFSTWSDLAIVQASWSTAADTYESWIALVEALDGLTEHPEIQWRGE